MSTREKSYSDMHVRIETGLKRQGDAFFDSIGLAPSTAVTMLYKSVVKYNALPKQFFMRVPDPLPDFDELTKEEIGARLDVAQQEIAAGKHYPADAVFKEILGDAYEEI